jgi:hypothetical protein
MLKYIIKLYFDIYFEFLKNSRFFWKSVYEYYPECCHEMDTIEGEQPICHYKINKGDVGDAAPFYAKFLN